MTEARFHRLAVLADVDPEALSSWLQSCKSVPRSQQRRIERAVAWLRADDEKRGRVGLPPPKYCGPGQRVTA